MSPLPMPVAQVTRSSRRNRRSMMSTASFSDDDDAITPCSSPSPAEHHGALQQQPLQPQTLNAAATMMDTSAPTALPHTNYHHVPHHRRGSANSDQLEACRDNAWHFDPAEGQAMDDEHLWRRMLAIQRTFHCYNSARMSAALAELEMGQDVGKFVPSRTCLDLLNDSISELPEEFRHELDSWLHGNTEKRR